MAPKVSEAHAAARKEQILMAAMTCFSRKGFHKTTMQDICKAADMSPGAVYSYFDSKDTIIGALCEMGEKMNTNMFQMVKSPDYASAQASYGHALEMFISQYKHPMQQTGARMDAMFMAEALHNDELAEMGVRSYRNIMGHIREMVSDSQRAGEVNPDLDVDAVCQVMFSLVQGLGTQMLMNGGEPTDVDAYLQAVLATLGGKLFADR